MTSNLITIYCPKCGRHWNVMGGLGQWIADCVEDEVACEICWHPEHCHQYLLNNRTVETVHDGGLAPQKKRAKRTRLP